MFNFPAATGTKGSGFVGHSRFLDLSGYLVLGCVVCMLEGYVHVKLAFFLFFFFKHVCLQSGVKQEFCTETSASHQKVLIFIFSQKGLPFSPVYSPDEI